MLKFFIENTSLKQTPDTRVPKEEIAERLNNFSTKFVQID